MASFHDAQGFRGNQGEEEDVDVISVELIAMIVPPELQDSPRTAAPESSASSSVCGGSESHRSAPVTSAAAKVVVFEGWENKALSGRLDSLCKAPKTLSAGFKFRAVLHHEVVDGAATVKGYKKLEEMVRRFQIPKTVLIRAGTPNERACSISRTGWVPVYVDHFDAGLRFPLPGLIFDVLAEYELALTQLTPNSIKFIIGFMLLCERLGMPAKAVVFMSLFLCRLCPSTSGTRWYYISGREKMMIFTNIWNKVARWKRQFVFIRDTRTVRMNNELTTRLSKWRTPNTYMNYPQLTVGDVDLKNWLLNYMKARGLVDLEALVTPEKIALRGFVDVENLHSQGEMSSILERQRQRAQGSRNRGAGSGSQRQSCFDERPLAAPGRSSQHRGSSSAQRPRVEQRAEPGPSSARRRLREDSDTEDNVPLTRRRTSTGSQLAPAGTQNFVPPAVRLCAKGHIQQHGGHAALIKLMDAFSYTVALFECEQGARVRNNELQTSCKQLATEKASLADEAAKEEAGRAEDRAKRAEADREKTLHDLNAMAERVSQVDQHVARAEASLEKCKRLHQHDLCFALAAANTTTDIFNEVRGKVLGVWANFPIGELAVFEGEEIDADGKSLAQPADTKVKLRWDLNEEGLPVWPPSVVEEGEDTEGLPSFDAWVADPHDVPAEPSSTPPSTPPQPVTAAAPAIFSPAHSSLDRSSPARSAAALNDASIPVDLTDD
ncbi:hypothetical protein SLEP1_g16837 [Rubroshorea leprosula]|uniref:Transposase (putative) gypsy type domain-containing protein n=1 Tax=Rubroshorea leprosula TaxID=152421 RepID=A0AAV5J2P7_9ROSI|nr:hypothetical protein SLEP1_g16837 [Rubroshorea leprosula]